MRKVESSKGYEVDGVNYTVDRFGVIHQQPPYEKFFYTVKYLKDRYFDIPDKVAAISHLRAGILVGVTEPNIGDAILDVGYGTGEFLGVLYKMQLHACGVEVIDYPPPEGCHRVTEEQMRYCHWHTVTFFDSVEHTVPHYLSILNTQYVMITAPWCHEPPSADWFRTWKHRRPNEHLYHFNPHSLKLMMKDYGYMEVWRGWPEDIIRLPWENRQNTFTSVFQRK